MHIAYFANVRIPTEKAHGIQIAKMAEAFALADTDNIVELILPTRQNKQLSGTSIYEYYGVRKNFDVKKIPTADPTFLFKFPGSLYIKVQTVLFAISLNRFLEKQNLSGDTIFYTRDQYLLPVLFRFSKLVVWEVHDLPKNKAKYAKHWNQCSKIIAITKGLKDELVKLGIDAQKVLVAPDGVDVKAFTKEVKDITQLRKQLGLPTDKKIALYSGHLYDWKGASILAEAGDYLDPNIVLAFLGGTDEDIASFKQRFSKPNIQILGRVPHDKVPEYLAAADILVLPNSAKKTISVTYTSPLKLFEYMAAGKPIIASKLPSILEIINHQSSLLVTPDAPEALANGINVLASSNIGEELAAKALVEVNKYSWSQRAENIINFINL